MPSCVQILQTVVIIIGVKKKKRLRKWYPAFLLEPIAKFVRLRTIHFHFFLLSNGSIISIILIILDISRKFLGIVIERE